ncbi:unnamed protein product, partial [Rotaria sp. Silwood1]
MADENQCRITTSNNTTCTTNHEISKEQQIAYGSAPVIYQPYSLPQSYVCVQPTPNSQIVNHYSPNNMVTQHQLYQQQVPSTINVSSAYVQQAMLHSNMNPQQALVSSYHPPVNTNVLFASSMTNPTVSSTPMSATTKRGRNDISGVSDSNAQERPQYYQTTRIFNARNTPNKRHCGINQQQKENSYPYRYEQNHQEQLNYNIMEGRNIAESTYDQQQPSMAACRYATSRFPFSPFSVIFLHQVREKVVIDDLMKHAKENFHFELKTIAYRRGRSENNECRILVFVENSESFSFLYERGNWPTTLAGHEFTTKRPSIPPQLSLVAIYAPASKSWEWVNLSSFITNRCIITGDFNIDIEKDGDKAERLLEWMDTCSLGPFVPDSNTSLRSDRTIDYALAAGMNLSIQTSEDDTSSDHKPLLMVLACDTVLKRQGSRIIWSVFSLMLSYTYAFWEKVWNSGP